jgi:hypothetical protein
MGLSDESVDGPPPISGVETTEVGVERQHDTPS